MSLRQRARISSVPRQTIDVGSGGSGSESDDEDHVESSTVVKTKQSFNFGDSSDSDSDSSSGSSDENNVGNSNDPKNELEVARTIKKTAVNPTKKEEYNEDDYLDSIIKELSDNKTAISDDNVQFISLKSVHMHLFGIEDTKNLDIDNILRRRLGLQGLQGGADADAGLALRGGRRNVAQRGIARGKVVSMHRKFIFGTPKDEWSKPPAFVTGGIGMDKYNLSDCEFDWYTFQWSPEFGFLDSQFQFIENSGNANLLVMYLAHFPHHPRAIIQLAMLYSRLGQVDRSLDLIRKSLYICECAFLDSFKPVSSGSSAVAVCVAEVNNPQPRICARMNPHTDCNDVYFLALFRYMQLCGNQGCSSVAADVCKVMLSLHPYDDAYFVLLTLDHFLVKAGDRVDEMLRFCGMNDESLASLTTSSNQSSDPSESKKQPNSSFWDFEFPTPYIFDDWREEPAAGTGTGTGTAADGTYIATSTATGSANSTSKGTSNHTSNDSASMTNRCERRGLAQLPNWWFSLAVSLKLDGLRSRSAHVQATTTTASTASTASSSSNTYANKQHIQSVPAASASVAQAQAQVQLELRTRAADFLLKSALTHWPFMMEPLMRKAGVEERLLSSSSMSPWKHLFSSKLFSNSLERVPRGSYLRRVSEIYAIRNASVWSREEILKWVLDCGTQLVADVAEGSTAVMQWSDLRDPPPVAKNSSDLQSDAAFTDRLIAQQCATFAELSAKTDVNKPLAQYEQAFVEDYAEELPRFPLDLRPIEPQLDDPHIYNGGVKFQNFMDGEGKFLFPVPEGYVSIFTNEGIRQRRAVAVHAAAALAADNPQDGQNVAEADDDDDDDDVMQLMLGANNNNAVLADAGARLRRRFGAPRRDNNNNNNNNNNRDNRHGNGAHSTNIDLNLPLLQLLIATLFPWVCVTPIRR